MDWDWLSGLKSVAPEVVEVVSLKSRKFTGNIKGVGNSLLGQKELADHQVVVHYGINGSFSRFLPWLEKYEDILLIYIK